MPKFGSALATRQSLAKKRGRDFSQPRSDFSVPLILDGGRP
jgi:hypothetical protein